MLVTRQSHLILNKFFIYRCRLQFYKNVICFQYQIEKRQQLKNYDHLYDYDIKQKYVLVYDYI